MTTEVNTFIWMAAITAQTSGPSVVMTLTNTIEAGPRAACIGIGGLGCGTTIVAVCVAGGLALTMARWPWVLVVLRMAGLVYLLYLAPRPWRASSQVLLVRGA